MAWNARPWQGDTSWRSDAAWQAETEWKETEWSPPGQVQEDRQDPTAASSAEPADPPPLQPPRMAQPLAMKPDQVHDSANQDEAHMAWNRPWRMDEVNIGTGTEPMIEELPMDEPIIPK